MFVALGSRHPRHGPAAVGSRWLRNRPQKGTADADGPGGECGSSPALVWAPSLYDNTTDPGH